MATEPRFHGAGQVKSKSLTLPLDSPEMQDWMAARRNFREAGMRLAVAEQYEQDEFYQQHAQASLKFHIMTVRLLELYDVDASELAKTGTGDDPRSLSPESIFSRKVALKRNKERLHLECDALEILHSCVEAELQGLYSLGHRESDHDGSGSHDVAWQHLQR